MGSPRQREREKMTPLLAQKLAAVQWSMALWLDAGWMLAGWLGRRQRASK